MTTTPSQRALIETLKGKLIVSSQAYPGEPMRHPETMAQIALSAQIGGAAAIRCQGLSDIAAIKGMVQVPVIGIWKEGEEGVFITPTVRHARCCMSAGADIVALDATSRPRPDGRTLQETAHLLKDDGAIIMADCASLDDARNSVEAGFDIISTTLAGYAPGRFKTEGPDFELLEQMVHEFPEVPVICEGRVHTPEQAARVMELGAWACVVGTAITHPMTITTWFKDTVDGVAAKR